MNRTARRSPRSFLLARRKSVLGLTPVVLLGSCLSLPVVAQSSAPGVESRVLEEVVVSAQRREQSLKDVPASVTVFDAEELQINRVTDVSDFVQLAPNVSFDADGSGLGFEISIRGVSNIGGSANAVGVYVDEFNVTPQDVSSTVSPELLDLAQIEVLRGPQGTLFGRNVTGGAILMSTVKPDVTSVSGRVTAEYANFGTAMLNGSLNLPLGDKAAVRVSAMHRETDGFIDDVIAQGGNLTNDREIQGGRVAFRVMPSERLTLDAALQYSDYQQGADDSVPIVARNPNISALIAGLFGIPVEEQVPSSLGAGFFPDNISRIASATPLSRSNETLTAQLRANYAGDAMDTTLIVGYIDNAFDQRGSVCGTCVEPLVVDGKSFFGDDGEGEFDSYSAELRFASVDAGQPLQWQAGAIYAEDESSSIFQRALSFFDFAVGLNPLTGRSLDDPFGPERVASAFGIPVDFLPFVPPFLVIDDVEETLTETFGVYGNLSWAINDRVTLEAGLRYSRDEVTEAFGRGDGFDQGSATFNLWTPRVSVVYALDDYNNAYATVSRGVKPGGANLGVQQLGAVGSATYDEESLWNYEVGLKGSLQDNRLSYTLSAFYMDWSDLQVTGLQVFQGDSGLLEGVELTQGIPETISYGVEAEMLYRATDNILLQVAMGWNPTEIQEFTNAVDEAGNITDVSGNEVPLAPKVTARATLQYTTNPYQIGALSGVESFARIEYLYRDSQYYTLLNEPIPPLQAPSYDRWSVRAGLRNDRVSLTAFYEGIDDDANLIGFGDASGAPTAVLQREQYGITLGYSF